MTNGRLRIEHEIEHGRFLAKSGAESIWGWGSPAGTVRSMRRANLIMNNAGLKPGMRVLEIGCGTGNFTRVFAKSGAEIYAVDISNDLLELAKQHSQPKNVQYILSRFEDMDSDAPFDAIIGSSILHHLDIPSALPNIYKLLKPGGKMCFAEPNMLNPQIAIQKNVPFIKKWAGDSPDETAFFRWVLLREMQRIGYSVIDIKPFDWLHPAVPQKLIGLITRIGLFLERLPGIREFAGSLLIKAEK